MRQPLEFDQLPVHVEETEPSTANCDPVFQLRPGLLLATFAALLCVTLEIEVVEQIDSLSLYLRYREIALEAGFALLILCGLSILFWLCVLLVGWMAEVLPRTKLYQSIGWRFGLSLPISYLVLDALGSFRLLICPRWHPGFAIWALLLAGSIALSTIGLHTTSVFKIQEFCRIRLVPIGLLHMAAAVIFAIVLSIHGVRLFHDYAHASNSVTISNSPDIYLITIDTFRAEDSSIYGYNLPTTPNLQRFAQRSLTFDYFFANSNFTATTTTSIETGKLPWTHRTFQMGGFLRGSAQGENVAQELRRCGYYTAMISSNYVATPFHHRTLESYDAVEYPAPLGITGAWLRYTNLIGLNTQNTLMTSLFERIGRARASVDSLILHGRYPYSAEQVFDRARTLVQRSDISQPRFVWLHIMPPHDPYWPPPPYFKRFLSTDALTQYNDFLRIPHDKLPTGISAAELRARYDEMLLYADHTVGDFLDWLDQTGRLDRAIVIVSADHGESFEHGWFFHEGPYLYSGLIRVPLLIHLPGQRRGTRISQVAEQADLLPTIIDLAGGQVPAWTDGISLKPAIEGKELPKRFVYSMNLEGNRSFDPITKGTLAIIDDEFKYVDNLDRHREELYRYKTDSLEEQNLVDSEPNVAGRMRDSLVSKLKEVNNEDTPKP
jgi:arylsulfatase A-like enzyme